AFLGITLYIGLRAGRGIKDIREYAIANKQLGTGILAMTILATYITGSKGIGYVGYVFDDGLLPVFSVILCGAVITFLFIAWYIAPNIQYFQGCLTLPELMGQMYGQGARFWMGLLGTFYSIAIVALQMVWLAYVGEMFNLPGSWSILSGGFLLVLYSARGGMKAVAITDVFQFIAILVFVPLVAYVILYQVGGIKMLFKQVPTQALDVLHHPSLTDYVVYCLWDLFPAFPLSFPFIQRMLTARDKTQLVNSYYIGLSFLTVFYLLLTLIGLAAIILRTTIDPNMPQQGSKVFVYLVSTYLPIGAKGIVGAGFIAGIMSTADSFLHAAGLALAHDVIQPRLRRKVDALKLVQYITFFLGLMALTLALFYQALPRVQYGGLDLGKGLNFITEAIALIFTIPLVAGIMGLKTDTRSFLVSSVTTTAVFIISRYYLSNEFIIPVAVATNLISFFGSHYIQHHGFAIVNRETSRQATHVWNPSWNRATQVLTEIVPTPQKLLHYSQNKAARYGTSPTLFALFISFSYMVPFYMHSYAVPATYTWLLAIRGIGALLCIGLLLQSYWPVRLLPYFAGYYYFTLLYCLPFVTTFLFFLEGNSTEWLLNVGLSIMLLIVLVDWAMFIWLSVLGVILAIGLYKLGIAPLAMHMDIETKYTLAYAVTVSTLIGLLFARRKEQRITQERRFMKSQGASQQASLRQSTSENRKVLQALQNTGAANLLTMIKSLYKLDVKKADRVKLEALQMKLIPMAFQLQGIDTRSQDYLRLHIQKDWPIEALLNVVKEKIQASGMQASIKIANESKQQTITSDPEQLATLLSKSIISLQGAFKDEEQTILMSLKDTQLTYPLPDVEKNYIKHVPALRIAITAREELPPIAPSYQPDLTNKATTMETTQELEQQANERIIKAHYGYAAITDDTLIYVIPLDVREVRLRDMDKPYMEVDATPKRANDHFKSDTVDAQAQEATFLTDVAARSEADLGLIKMALELIKWYHGPSERKSGEPFYLHPLAVAQIVLDYNQDEATIVGALLHDTVEDTPMLLQHIETVFGKETAKVVDLVTHLQSIEGSIYKIKMSASENLKMLDQAGNKRGLYVKIADRMHNMRTIKGHSKVSKRKLIAQETADFFVPLAKRLGLKEAAEEFEKMCVEVFTQKD
ncbi:MAG: HD domain-containing protein, partial [Bacteroidota bacterium]